VIALGGMHFNQTALRPPQNVSWRSSEKHVTISDRLWPSDYEIALVHGNGPQFGRIVLALETAKDVAPPLPLDVCETP